jgi:hypothetical protein
MGIAYAFFVFAVFLTIRKISTAINLSFLDPEPLSTVDSFKKCVA